MRVIRCNMMLLVLGLLSIMAGCNGTPLADYQSHSKSEAEIKAVLLEYLDAKRKFDIQRYLASLHAEGLYHFECGRMLSKAELGQLLPKFWADLQFGNPAFYPINRECITGDYFDTGRYVDPRMDVDGDTARVALKFTVGWWGLEHYVTLVRKDRAWLISRLDWEMN